MAANLDCGAIEVKHALSRNFRVDSFRLLYGCSELPLQQLRDHILPPGKPGPPHVWPLMRVVIDVEGLLIDNLDRGKTLLANRLLIEPSTINRVTTR